MFEKEAEEYTIENVCSACYFEKPCENKCEAFGCADSKTYVLKAFKDGAECGYNKANEWHKADVPTTPINKVVLGYIKDYNTKKFCLVKWNGEWWYDARTWNDKVKLIAWKEIVLPELPKESE